MSKQVIKSDTHHLLFQDYKFPLVDRDFLDRMALHVYDGASRSKRVTDAIRETLRILTAYSGFQAQYSLASNMAELPRSQEDVAKGKPVVTYRQVHEHIALVGQDTLPFAVLDIVNGPRKIEGEYTHSPRKLVEEFEKFFEAEQGSEWWLKEDEKFQLATFTYEWRRIVLDLPVGFGGRVWKDAAGKIHFYATQGNDPEFADERLNVHLIVVPPSRFNGAVVEKEEAAQKDAAVPA
jgi:hypothetical protein